MLCEFHCVLDLEIFWSLHFSLRYVFHVFHVLFVNQSINQFFFHTTLGMKDNNQITSPSLVVSQNRRHFQNRASSLPATPSRPVHLPHHSPAIPRTAQGLVPLSAAVVGSPHSSLSSANYHSHLHPTHISISIIIIIFFFLGRKGISLPDRGRAVDRCS